MRYLIVLVVVLAFPIVSQSAVSTTPKPELFGSVHLLRGKAERRMFVGPNIQTVPLQADNQITTREVIATESDGIVTLSTLSDDSLTLFPSSRMIIQHSGDGRYQVKLVYGKLKVKTRSDFELNRGHRLEIQTFNTVIGATGPSEFTIYRDLVERCKQPNTPQCPSVEYSEETSKLLVEKKLFSGVYVTRSQSPLYVGLLHNQEWDTERYIKLGQNNRQMTLGERQWVIASEKRLKRSGAR